MYLLKNNVTEIGCRDDLIQEVADKNVQIMVEKIKQRSQVLNDLLQARKIGIVGGMYDIETGKVKFYEA